MPYTFNPFTGNFDVTTSDTPSVPLSSYLPLSGGIVRGNLSIAGNLSASGVTTFFSTTYTTTTSLSVNSTGPGTAVYVYKGPIGGPVAVFNSSTGSNLLYIDNNATSSNTGIVGINTNIPNKALTVVGDISATGSINASTISVSGSRAAQGAPNNYDSSTNGYSFGTDGDTGIFSPIINPTINNNSGNGVVSIFGNEQELLRADAPNALVTIFRKISGTNALFNTVTGTHYGDGSNLTGTYPANQLSVNSLVTNTSGSWNSAYTSTTAINLSTGNWNNTTNQVNASSSKWNAAYNSTVAINLSTGLWNNAVSNLDNTYTKIINSPIVYGSGTSSIQPTNGTNNSSGYFTTINGGIQNAASNNFSVVGGGTTNKALNDYAVVAGGGSNCATGPSSSVLGGQSNTASGRYTSIGGGCSNVAGADNSYIVGGQNNITSYNNTFIIGSNIATPAANYTYVNNISSQGIVAANGGNSNNWNSAYSATLSSGTWNNTTNQVNTSASNWNNAYVLATSYQNTSGSFATNSLVNSASSNLTTTINSVSGSLFTIVNNVSGNLNTTISNTSSQLVLTTTLRNVSSSLVTAINNVSSNLNTTISNTSSQLVLTTTFVNTTGSLISTINSVSGSLNTAINSASSQLLLTTIYQNASGSFATNSNVRSISSSILSTVNSVSGNLTSIINSASSLLLPITTYQNTSSNYVQYTDINSVSGNWDAAYSVATDYQSASSNYVQYTDINSVSGNWDAAYNRLSTIPYTTSTTSILPVSGSNTASGGYSNILGGVGNYIEADCAFIGGGQNNCIDGARSVIVGGGGVNPANNNPRGDGNYAGGTYSVIVGGVGNSVLGDGGIIVGGIQNTACNHAFVGGGFNNTASGDYSSIIGGSNNCTNGQANTFIVGSNITATANDYTYVNNLSSQGVVSAAYFYGDGSNLIGASLPGQSAVNTVVRESSGNWNSAYTYLNSATANTLTLNNLSIGGSIYLQGSAYAVSTSQLVVGNPIIYLSQDNPGDSYDIGFVGHNVVNNTYSHTGLLRTHGAGNPGTWYLFSSMVTEPSSNNVAGNNKVIDTLVANVSGDGSKLFNLDSTKLTGLSANNWNSITTAYQNTSGNFLTNTNFLTAYTNNTTLNTLTGSLLPTSTYQNTSGVFVKSDTTTTTSSSAVKNMVILPYTVYTAPGFTADPNTVYILV
jgi:hypothetical protein